MFTANNLSSINHDMKLALAAKTQASLAKGEFSAQVCEALKRIESDIREAIEEGRPYRDDSFYVRVSEYVDERHYNELQVVLRNLGFTVEPSCSSNWTNEQLSVSWA